MLEGRTYKHSLDEFKGKFWTVYKVGSFCSMYINYCHWPSLTNWLVCGCVVTVWWMCGHCVIPLWSLCDPLVVTVWSPCSHCVVPMWSPCGYRVVMWSPCDPHVVNVVTVVTCSQADWMVWPAAQYLNFYLLPPHLRVVYVAAVTGCWDGYLSYVKHKVPTLLANPLLNWCYVIKII